MCMCWLENMQWFLVQFHVTASTLILGDICRQQLRLVAVWLCLRTRIENSKDPTQP